MTVSNCRPGRSDIDSERKTQRLNGLAKSPKEDRLVQVR